MDFRKVFDRIPAQFDRWRPRYCDAAFDVIIQHANLGPDKTALEIGPGTGQATVPILKTGCQYLGIELGDHLAAYMTQKFQSYDNCHIVNADFETYDFGPQKFDLVYAAATLQWIPEEIGFGRSFALLKPGGTFAMMLTKVDYQSANPKLYEEIQTFYGKYFHPETEYTCHLKYDNVVNYGFVDFTFQTFPAPRVLTADAYMEYIGTHCDHIVLPEEDKHKLFEGIRAAIQRAGGTITLADTVVLFLARKPVNQ